MSRTAQISKEKQQSIMTLRHEGRSIRKISRTLKVTFAKTIKHYDESGSHEDCYRKGRPRVTCAAENELELTAPHIAAQINDSQAFK
jgi:hypothetical protein